MFTVLRNSWALFLGLMLFMLGNGLQGTLLGVRGSIEGFGTGALSLVMSAYFAGFLLGSRLAPHLIRRVGHVRVFAALGSLISAVLILFPAVPNPVAWVILRVIIGFAFAGIYVVSESWLNDSATNETRGQTLSLYLIVQMIGIIAAQALLNVADPAGFILFIIPSVLVSLAFAPILLSVSPAPAFQATKPMTLRELYSVSPLGMVGSFLLGGVFAAQFGMAAVYGTAVGLSLADLSIFISMIYVGGLVCQYPLGWLSDRVDRRFLILCLAAFCSLAMLGGYFLATDFAILLAVAFVMGGVSNPLYALIIAHTNDCLSPEDMPAASGGLIFFNGMGAILGPLLVGWAMSAAGPEGFFLYLVVVLAAIAVYTAWRMSRRAGLPIAETAAMQPVAPMVSPVVVEAAQEVMVESLREAEEGENTDRGD